MAGTLPRGAAAQAAPAATLPMVVATTTAVATTTITSPASALPTIGGRRGRQEGDFLATTATTMEAKATTLVTTLVTTMAATTLGTAMATATTTTTEGAVSGTPIYIQKTKLIKRIYLPVDKYFLSTM